MKKNICCNRCGESISDPYHIISVYFSDSFKFYKFCDNCYKNIAKVMKDKNEILFNIAEIREKLAKVKQDFLYPARTYSINNNHQYYWPTEYPQVNSFNIHRIRRAITSVTV